MHNCTYFTFQKANVSENEYIEAFQILTQKSTVVMQRKPSECWINAYNDTLLRSWNANIDIQYCLNPYSVIMYIISYITKSERNLSMLIKRAQDEARHDNPDAISELKLLGKVYLTHREISVMESVYRATGLKLKMCSREVTFVPTDENCIRWNIRIFYVENQINIQPLMAHLIYMIYRILKL